MSTLLKTDKEYKEWIVDVSNRFRQSQIKAAVKVNSEMLQFYWSIGKDLSTMDLYSKYGSGFYKTVSSDLKEIFPDVSSFSPTNLKYMRYFYEMYSYIEDDNSSKSTLVENRQQVVDDSETQIELSQLEDIRKNMIFRIPWGHHVYLLGKCKDNPEKALFYVRKTIENSWSRAVLENYMSTNLYEREGKAVSNFKLTLPPVQSDLAQSITKDPYNFDFLTMSEKYNEKELKDELINNISKFLLELGTGFAYMGREVRIMVGAKEKFLDLLFYNTKSHCYVVVEVKTKDFDSSNAGQLGTYVVAVNHQLKTEHDNPTIGILVCNGLDKVEAQYALESSSQPIGVSSYELSKLIPENFKGSLPTIEELEAELNDNIMNSKSGDEV